MTTNKEMFIYFISRHELGYSKTIKKDGEYSPPCKYKIGARCKKNSYVCNGAMLIRRNKFKIKDNYCEIPTLQVKAELRLLYEGALKGYKYKTHINSRKKLRTRQMMKCYKQEYIYRQKMCESCNSYINDDYLCLGKDCKQPKWWSIYSKIKKLGVE